MTAPAASRPDKRPVLSTRQFAEATQAAAILASGGIVGLPTETVYGLAADASNPQAVARIFAAKQRPTDHPLIVHLHNVNQISDWASEIPRVAWQLAEAFWPGPLTLILRRASGVLDAITGGQESIALRIPRHELALSVLQQFGRGIAAPSANRYGRISPTSAEHVREELGDAVDLVLDGGACSIGIESTIVDLCSGALRILRPGAITAEHLRAATGVAVAPAMPAGPRSPGTSNSHYAPSARVSVVSPTHVLKEVEKFHTMGWSVGVLSSIYPSDLPTSVPWLSLGFGINEQARQVYRRLREADHMGLAAIVAVLPEDIGIGHALRDRLRRAAGLGDLSTTIVGYRPSAADS